MAYNIFGGSGGIINSEALELGHTVIVGVVTPDNTGEVKLLESGQ